MGGAGGALRKFRKSEIAVRLSPRVMEYTNLMIPCG